MLMLEEYANISPYKSRELTPRRIILPTSTMPSSNDDKPEEHSWYWNNSSNNGIFDSDEGKNDIPDYDSKSDSEPKLFLSPNLSTTSSIMLKWEYKADAKLCGGWEAGSQSIKERQLRNAREFQKQAS